MVGFSCGTSFSCPGIERLHAKIVLPSLRAHARSALARWSVPRSDFDEGKTLASRHRPALIRCIDTQKMKHAQANLSWQVRAIHYRTTSASLPLSLLFRGIDEGLMFRLLETVEAWRRPGPSHDILGDERSRESSDDEDVVEIGGCAHSGSDLGSSVWTVLSEKLSINHGCSRVAMTGGRDLDRSAGCYLPPAPLLQPHSSEPFTSSLMTRYVITDNTSGSCVIAEIEHSCNSVAE